MLTNDKKSKYKVLENSLRLEIAIIKYNLIESIVSNAPPLERYSLQEEMIKKEIEYKNVMLGNYNKLHYSV